MKILSIIPARSGSKGIPNKNIIKICDKPLISYSINLSINTKIIDYTFVSTDSDNIKVISEKYGAKVPFLRPKKISSDNSNVYSAIIFSLRKLEKILKIKFDVILILQPTSPLRLKKDITSAVNLLLNNNFDSVISVTKYDGVSPYIMYENHNNALNLVNNHNYYQRQQYGKIYYRNGLIYAIKRNTLIKKKSLYGKNIGYILIPKLRSINLDTKKDLKILKEKEIIFDKHFYNRPRKRDNT